MQDNSKDKQIEDLAAVVQNKSDKAYEYYKSLFENSYSIMLIISPDNGNIIDANIAACKYYGYSREKMKNMQITDINTLSPEQVYEELQNARAEKRNYFNFRHRLASGEIRDVEVFSGPITLSGRQVLYSIIHDISDRKQIELEKEKLIAKLEKALKEIKSLKGIIPICSSCKKIRDDKGYWEQIEAYIKNHSEAEFSHSICPECARILYPHLNLPERNET